MLHHQILLLALSCSVNAIAFDYPQPTGFQRFDPQLGAQPPAPTPTPFAEYAHGLMRRDPISTWLIGPDNTCGFFNGRSGAPLSCPATDSCVFVSASQGADTGNVACCPASGSCGIRYACVDSAAYNASQCDDGCRNDIFTLKCTYATAPFCNSVTFVDNLVSDYYCNNANISTWQTLYTTWSGEADGRLYVTSIVDPSATGSKSSSSKSSSSGGSVVSSSSSSSSTTTTPTPTPVPIPSPGPPLGAIIGGSVGGAAVLILGGLLIWYLVRRNRKNKASQFANTPSPAVPYVGPNHNAGVDPNSAYGQAQAKMGQMHEYQSPTGYGYPPPQSPPADYVAPPNPANQGFYQKQYQTGPAGETSATSTSPNSQFRNSSYGSPQTPHMGSAGPGPTPTGYNAVPQHPVEMSAQSGPFATDYHHEAPDSQIQR